MTKYAAFGTHLEVGTAQIETGLVVCPTGAATGTGNVTVNITDGTINEDEVIGVVTGDTLAEIARKLVTGMLLEAVYTARYNITYHGPYVQIERVFAEANDAALELTWTSAGLGITNNADSAETEAGIAKVEVAAVKNIGGPALSVDSDDVTTHDSTGYWEEVVTTILRSGEVTLEIVYDPADNTHDATDTNGLVYRLKNKDRTYFDLMFMGGALNWTFFGYVSGFEPSAPVGGHLAATVKAKITGQPTLE